MFAVRMYDVDKHAYSRVVADFPEYAHAYRFCEEVLEAHQVDLSPGSYRSAKLDKSTQRYYYENYAIFYYQ